MKMKTMSFSRSVLAAALSCGLPFGAAYAAQDGLGVTFADYAVGERLSDKGASGGTWGAIDAAIVATNVVFDSVKAMDINTFEGESDLSFSGEIASRQSQYDFKMAFDFADDLDGRKIDATACGFTAGKTKDGVIALAGACGGTWRLLFADGFTARLDRMYDLRFETRSIGGAVFVSYLVKSGGDYLRLADATGKSWFRTAREADESFGSVTFSGAGRISDFSGGPGSVEPTTAYHWIGTDGDWSKPANWSHTAGGPACDRVPGAGDTVRVDGTVKLVSGDESATVTDFIGHFTDATTQEMLAGSLVTPVTIDTSHPRAGKALSVKTGSFFGLRPEMVTSCVWQRGTTAKAYEATPVSTTESYTFSTGDYEHWFKVHAEVKDAKPVDAEFFFSKLPVFYLTTDDGQTPSSQKEEHDGKIVMQSGDFQLKDDELFSGKMTIKVRGNSTRGYAKKPWKIKLDKKWGATFAEKYKLPKSKHWVLLANYNDKSNMRNKLAYDFANAIGSLGMKSTWVVCTLNGVYQGCYQLGEHIRIDENRVNVYDWEGAGEDAADAVAEKEGFAKADKSALEDQMKENLGWVTAGTVTYKGATYRLGDYVDDFASVTNDITGGYLFESSEEYDEVTKFTVNSGKLKLKTMLNSPEFLCSNPAMTNWCVRFLQNYCDAITSADGYSSEDSQWSDYCRTDSMAAYFLVMEMFGNNDASYKSRYFYKERGEKMAFGPVWDFDWGVGNDIVMVNHPSDGWKVRGNDASFYREWADDPWFCTRAWTLYRKSARAAFAALMAEGGPMDGYKALLTEAGAADDAKWLNDPGWAAAKRSDGSLRPTRYFIDDVELLRTYLSERLTWLDAQFASVPSLLKSYKTSSSSSPYEPDATSLPIAFANAPTNCVCDGQSLRLVFVLGGSGIEKVDVFANGLRVQKGLVPAEGRLDAVIPANALTADKGDPNCVSFVAYDASGKLKARNYALVTVTDFTSADATPWVMEGDKVIVPSVPHKWIRDAVAASPNPGSIATATPEEFAAVVREAPSPWGKATPLWRDYVAGTDPNPAGPNAEFRVTSFAVTNGVPYVSYSPDLGDSRLYAVEGRADLKEGEWTAPAPADARFFRVRVELPAPQK